MSKIRITNEDVKHAVRSSLKKFINESYNDYEEEHSPFEEYEQGYPNSDFNPEDITKTDLIKWCLKVGDFLYIYKNPFRGTSRISGANTPHIMEEIVSDIARCAYIEPTREFDSLLWSREREFEDTYVAVLKLVNVPNEEDYAIIYQIPRD